MALSQANQNKIRHHIAARREFTHGNMSGRWLSSTTFSRESYGELPQETVSEMRELLKDRDLYIVYSYRTPIAYAWDRETFVPDHHYSMTTTLHQTLARTA